MSALKLFLAIVLVVLSGLAFLHFFPGIPVGDGIRSAERYVFGPLALAVLALALLVGAAVAWSFFRSPRRIPRFPWLHSAAAAAATLILLAALHGLSGR